MTRYWLKTMKNSKCIIFDLDDTLVYEIDFLKSAYKHIAFLVGGNNEEFELMIEKYRRKENVFLYLSVKYNVEVTYLLEQYRNHFPTIGLIDGAKDLLSFCKESGFILGLISDGRSITQRNKLKALNIEEFFDKIVISEEIGSEKPNFINYSAFIQNYGAVNYFYIADNYGKDFLTPNELGWTTIALKDAGRNIHKQDFSLESKFLPRFLVQELSEVKDIINL